MREYFFQRKTKMKKLMICTLVMLVAAFGSRAKADNPAEWTFYLETLRLSGTNQGEDTYWDSPTNVDTGYPEYEWTLEVTQGDMRISGLGWISGVPPDGISGSGIEPGLPFGSCEWVEEPGVFAANICEGVDEFGYGYVSMTDVTFGSTSGLDVTGFRMGGNVIVTPEPATVLLLGLGSLALLRKRRA